MSEVLRKYNTPVVPTTPGKPPDVRPGLVVYEAFQEAFNSLPLATLIEKDGRKVGARCMSPSLLSHECCSASVDILRWFGRSPCVCHRWYQVFVCHGGLFERPGVKLSHIMAIKVWPMCPRLHVPNNPPCVRVCVLHCTSWRSVRRRLWRTCACLHSVDARSQPLERHLRTSCLKI